MPAFSLGRRNSWRERLAHLDEQSMVSERVEEPTIDQLEVVRTTSDEAFVPQPLRIAAAWSWRLLVLAGSLGVFWWLGGQLSEVVIPLMAALLLSAALAPLNAFLRNHRFPAWAAALTSLLVLVLIIGGLLTLVGAQIVNQWTELTKQAGQGLQSFLTWLGTGPLHISHDQVTQALTQLREKLAGSQNEIASLAAKTGSSIGKFFAGLAMALFATFFFVKDAPRFSRGIKANVPRAGRSMIVPGLDAGWHSLVSYVHAAVIVAAADGIGAGLGAMILGSNLWLAITALTFVCAFVPLIGALISGVVAVTVTLVTLGLVKAVIMLAVFVAVMQLEGHILQPLLLGRAVSIHPLVVLVGIAIGITVAGVVGGVFAIPIVAFASGVVRAARRDDELPDDAGDASGNASPPTGPPGAGGAAGVPGPATVETHSTDDADGAAGPVSSASP